MSDVFIGRQPILDRRGRTVAFELLFRQSLTNSAVILDDSHSTQRVLGAVLSDFGIETLAPAADLHINVSKPFLAARLYEMLPAARTVLEIVHTQAVDDDLIRVIDDARYRGYRVAITISSADHGVSALLEHADLAKIDARMPEADFRATAAQVPAGLVVIADKVETHEERMLAETAGAQLFQGFFFQEPETLTDRAVGASRIAMLRLLAELEDVRNDLGRVCEVIEADAGLTVRLLRMTNAATFSLPRTVESVRECVHFLGTEQVRQLATVLALTAVDDKPTALATQALVRARLAEACAARAGVSDSAAFTVGLLSLVHALVDRPAAEIVDQLPLSPEVSRAILGREGELGRVLRAIEAWERSEPDQLLAYISATDLADVTVATLRWASELARAVEAPRTFTPA